MEKSKKKGKKKKDRTDKELVATFLEHHRFYISRNWNYFGGILLVNSVIYNSFDKLVSNPLLLSSVTISALIVIAVFYHLINWTNMRIDTNMEKVNDLLEKYKTDFPESVLHGLINWMKLAITILTLPYFILAYQSSLIAFIMGIIIFVGLIITSEMTTRSFRKEKNVS
jgi:uncharacterized membrane protein YesL